MMDQFGVSRRDFTADLNQDFLIYIKKVFFQGVCVDIKDVEGRKIIYDVRYDLWKIIFFKKNVVNFS